MSASAPLQGEFAGTVASMQFQTSDAPAENRTGMPDRTKAGLEQFLNLDLSGLRVHYDFAQLNAMAEALGSDIRRRSAA